MTWDRLQDDNGMDDTIEAAASKLDARKMIDEFKKPLDDTRTLLDHFAMRREVPTVLLLAQVEAMREHQQKLQTRLARVRMHMEELDALTKRSRAQTETLAELGHEKRRIDVELKGLQEQLIARRDDVLAKTSKELIRATEAYDQGFADILKARGEPEALEAITAICEPLLPEKLDEREEARPRQPAKIGQPNQCRTLLALAERADAAVRPGGPLERLTAAAVERGGEHCYCEIAGVKGFRRCLQKAQQDYLGDFLMLNDVARCTIVAPRLSALRDVLRWLIDSAKDGGADEGAEGLPLPEFEPLMIKDRLSPSFDAEGTSSYRYLLIVGRLMVDSVLYSERSNPRSTEQP